MPDRPFRTVRPARRARAAALAGLALAACGPRPAPTPAPPVAEPRPFAVVHACADGFRFAARTLGARGDTVRVAVFPATELTLAQVPAASGARYEGAGAVYWSRGDRATLEHQGERHADCPGQRADTPWDEARLLGIELRAVGQEPGWTLDIDAGRTMRYVGDYGATRANTPAPEPTRDAAGTVTYRARTEAHDLTVTIREAPCQDVMSGEPYPQSVTVRLDGREVRGCGRTLGTGDVTNTYWKLVELDGKPAVAAAGAREAHLRLFDDGSRVAGSTGCNDLAGRFERNGDALRLVGVASTRRACLDAAIAAQEQGFLKALGATDRAVARGDTLTLHAGTRPLARLVAVWLR